MRSPNVADTRADVRSNKTGVSIPGASAPQALLGPRYGVSKRLMWEFQTIGTLQMDNKQRRILNLRIPTKNSSIVSNSHVACSDWLFWASHCGLLLPRSEVPSEYGSW